MLTKLEAKYWSALFLLDTVKKCDNLRFHIFSSFVSTYSK